MTAPTILFLLAATLFGPDRIDLGPSSVTVDAGETVTVTATVRHEDGTVLPDAPVRWIATNTEVAAVDQSGRVTGVSPGEARIAARTGNVMAFARVVVRALPVAVLKASLPQSTLIAGTGAPILVRAAAAGGEPVREPALVFSSSDESVAGVDGAGRVYARGAGEASVVVSSGRARASVTVNVREGDLGEVVVTPAEVRARTGDVIRFRAEGPVVLYPEWSVGGAGAQIEADGADGVFVAELPGTYRIAAMYGEGRVAVASAVVSNRIAEAELVRVGRGPSADHHSGDAWVFEGADGRDYAYVGTFMYDWMKVWDVTNPGRPVLTDSVQLDARRINDVKIHPGNRIGILTREGASDRRNGIVILDLSDPAHPAVISEYKRTVPGGVHNVWIEDHLVYAVHNGTRDIHIIDISDPASPNEVGRWGLPPSDNKSLHDVIVQDGYAYLSYWDDGVVMLDAGAGTHGGTPTEPAFVSRYKYPAGNTHTAWRAGRYLFVGDEIFPDDWNADAPIEARGYIHVLDMEDPEHPVEVARYEVPEAGAHNIWVEGDRLYVGYYQAGLRVVDISGELRGDLYRQGREIAVLKTTDAETTVPNWGMTWGAQIHKGHVFTSDLNSGLWVVKLIEGRRIVS
ncbi:MAG: Ig-like domain-containing protein [Gemmatimonadota bacterium]|nr:Ig-like domain-containing protein [Gemmatimonadota bacterium]